MFAGEQRCHIDVTAEAPRRTSMRQRCSRAAPAARGRPRGSPALRRRALLLVGGDPTTDISAIRDVRIVVSRGRVVHASLAA